MCSISFIFLGVWTGCYFMCYMFVGGGGGGGGGVSDSLSEGCHFRS